ncbi:unnamed protein product [Vitrella brassicaformis CCMP3155]|uniref:Uncharacterized protein n=1 Tax=Vitrella brassicaformis (strain CCMP3155) TaxID=1169540 RepID=A0A0G4GWK7_VITBC|nr:unnamed protein product [Vitrella brassicaformis CCMP3155]|eukprot:CEM35361.1 unnamed protein product [Vitrella brassicaformis CCMP3155]
MPYYNRAYVSPESTPSTPRRPRLPTPERRAALIQRYLELREVADEDVDRDEVIALAQQLQDIAVAEAAARFEAELENIPPIRLPPPRTPEDVPEVPRAAPPVPASPPPIPSPPPSPRYMPPMPATPPPSPPPPPPPPPSRPLAARVPRAASCISRRQQQHRDEAVARRRDRERKEKEGVVRFRL